MKSAILRCALSNRCRADKTRWNVLRFVIDFLDFAGSRVPPAPVVGPAAVVSVAAWLDLIALRGRTVPSQARYALLVFSEALGMAIPHDRPAVLRCTRIKAGLSRKAPVVPTDFVFCLEREAANRENPEGSRLYCSLYSC